MNQPGEVVRVRKLASAVQRRDNLVPTSGRLLRKSSVHPSCKKTLAELLVLTRVPPTIKSGVRVTTRRQPYSRPIDASGLLVVLVKARSASDVRLTWKYRNVAK
ncbi:hypothetical protein BHE74_00020622 [Ensete ventricosum]|nr:hypothetical protein BHE74_00020622 [Ensete ventricosum]RZS25648.1 hypothetical protein BHM03_00058871 [Ensete ventricosum]